MTDAKLNTADLALTWVVFQPEQTMVYVNTERATQWEANGIDWQIEPLKPLKGLKPLMV